MRAMIFAAGLGSRLKPLTDDRPKALVEVNGRTLLELNIKKLMTEGFNDIVVNVHHFGDKVIDYLRTNNGFGANIYISDERCELLDTGGAIKYARRFLDIDENFLIYNVDVVSDINLRELYQEHVYSGAFATLAVRKRDSDRQLLFDDNGRMRGWKNLKSREVKPMDLNVAGLNLYAYSGVQIVNKAIFESMPMDNKFSIIDHYVRICVEKKILFFDHSAGKWFDIGTADKLRYCLSVI